MAVSSAPASTLTPRMNARGKPAVVSGMTAPKTLELMHHYSESGYRGETEYDTTYSLEVTTVGYEAVVTLVVDKTTTEFPSNRVISQQTQRYQVPAMALVELIKKAGKLLPQGPS